jgi:IMP dehydrogenase
LDTNPKLRISNAYSFDDISIVPGTVTIDPDKVTTDFCIGSYKFSIPIIAAAMDAITSPNFIQKLNDLGGLGVMNLEGIQTRYKNPDEKKLLTHLLYKRLRYCKNFILHL